MTDNPNAAPKKVDEGSEGEEEQITQQAFNYYLKQERFFKIVTTKWGVFTIIAGACYLYEIIWTISGVNNYCDITRTFNTDKAGTLSCISTLAKVVTKPGEIAQISAVYDFPILIVTIYHMIEWVRWTVLLTAALVDANLIPVFYFGHLNIIFGFFAMLIAIIGGFSAADNCGTIQPERARYLSLQIICLVLWIPVSFAPIIFMKMKGAEWVHQQFIADPDDEEEEDEKKADD